MKYVYLENDMLVTIITVTFNSATTVSRTIESVLNQTYRDIEYFIVDGLSSDRTVDIAHSYEKAFQSKGMRYRVISEKDKGMYDALNKGAKLASGVLIGQINSDDWYEPNAVMEMVDLYNREHYDIAWADLRIKRAKGDIVKKAGIGRIWTTATFCHPSMFSRKEVLQRFPYAVSQMDDDFDMVTRAYKAGVKFSILNKIIANYTIGGMSTQKDLKKMCERINMKYQTYRKNDFSRLYWFYCVAVEFAKYIAA